MPSVYCSSAAVTCQRKSKKKRYEGGTEIRTRDLSHPKRESYQLDHPATQYCNGGKFGYINPCKISARWWDLWVHTHTPLPTPSYPHATHTGLVHARILHPHHVFSSVFEMMTVLVCTQGRGGRLGVHVWMPFVAAVAVALVPVVVVRAAAPGLHDCPASAGLGHSACPNDAKCCTEQYFGAAGCSTFNSQPKHTQLVEWLLCMVVKTNEASLTN